MGNENQATWNSIKPELVYGNQTWLLAESYISPTRIFERGILRNNLWINPGQWKMEMGELNKIRKYTKCMVIRLS